MGMSACLHVQNNPFVPSLARPNVLGGKSRAKNVKGDDETKLESDPKSM